ncbi:MAG: PLP-dependent cysteine synthase family protein [Chloroflexi bacterium]|nr:PLP-dependent cysteine synthase family protein [Chloroflexota bacterium]
MPQSKEFLELAAQYPGLQAIGNTRLVRLDLGLDIGEAEIYAKLENLNPGGSIKDRPVLRMLLEARLAGDLTDGKTVLDSTSGNAGIAYAMIGATIGAKVELVMPGNASTERKQRIEAHGANAVLTDPLLGYDEAMREVRRRFEANPDKYFFSDQYSNDNNWKAHYDTTAAEILQQAPDLTHFVAGIGTGGTITGTGRRLKQQDKNIRIACITPGDWRGIEGLKPLDEGHIVPKIFDPAVVNEYVSVDVDEAYKLCRLLASKGFFVGQSSGAYVLGAYTIAKRERKGKFVTIFNDLGERYFSTGMWARSVRS